MRPTDEEIFGLLSDLRRHTAFDQYPRALRDRINAAWRRYSTAPAECANCGKTGGHEEYCVHHPDVQARLK